MSETNGNQTLRAGVALASLVAILASLWGITNTLINPLEAKVNRLEVSVEKLFEADRLHLETGHQRTSFLERQLFDHQRDAGHPSMLTQIATLEQKLEALAEKVRELKRTSR